MLGLCSGSLGVRNQRGKCELVLSLSIRNGKVKCCLKKEVNRGGGRAISLSLPLSF